MKTAGDLVYELDETDTTSTEPALTPAAILSSLYGISFFVLKQFVPSISNDTINNWYAAMTPLLVLILGWVIRRKVWSPNSVQKVVDQSVTNALRESNTKIKIPPKNYKDYEQLKKEYPPTDPPEFGTKNL